MTNGTPGRVYWSAEGRRFYQEGRRGSVGREEAVSHLSRDKQGRLRDQRGRFVPDKSIRTPEVRSRRFIGHDQDGRPFVSAEFRDRLTTRDAHHQTRLPGNQMLVIRTVVKTPDGKIHVSYTSSTLGSRINIERLEALADKRAAGQLRGKGYAIGTNAIGNSTLRRDYITRTVTTRR